MKHNRVLVFSTDDHLYPAGGAEQAFGNITERLPHIEFDLICAKLRPGMKGFEKVKNVNIHRMGFGIKRTDGIILALFGHYCAYKLMRKHSYDLVWSIMASYGAFAAVRVKKHTGLPFLLTLQEGDSFDYIYKKVRHVRAQFDEIFRSADGVQAISNYLLSWARTMGHRSDHEVVIPNGVVIDAFTKQVSSEARAHARASFGFSPGAFILFTSSRLEPKNGLRYVIEALPYLDARVCFVMCGSGSLHEELRSRVDELGLTSRVLFKGFVDPSELPLLMNASDAFIRPSLSEGLGTAFLEAMAARLPVIATTVGGIADFLTDGETGFEIQVKDAESIVRAVERVMALPTDERERLLDRGESMVRERYDWEKIGKRMEVLFNEMVV